MTESRWVRACAVTELQTAGSLGLVLENVRVAFYWHEGRPWALSNVCNHKGGPLAGSCNGEFAKCRWHGWEYSVKTGRGPSGYEKEAVPTHAVEVRGGEVWVDLTPATKRQVVSHSPHPLARKVEHGHHEGVRVLGVSTTEMDSSLPRFSTSEFLLDHALAHARTARGAETQLFRLRELRFKPCEGNYSKGARACTWPCAITEREPDDGLTPVYEALVHWADVVVVATPIRWGAPSALYAKLVERMNCIQNQMTIANNVLIQRKVASFIITGGQDGIQAVAGSALTFFAELGFQFPPFPFIGHSRGWEAEDMERNIDAVRQSQVLREGAEALVERAIDSAALIHGTVTVAHGGRKASGGS